MKPLPMSPWQKFKRKYGDGCGSELCKLAMKVCLTRGNIPCDLLFIAESPGESEDSIGQVLIGPAGKYFTDIENKSIPEGISVGRCNLIGCLPREFEGGQKAGQPSEEEIEACSERLKDFIVLCNPKLIICVGTISRDCLDRKSSKGYRMYWKDIDKRLEREIPMEFVLHPSYLMRQNEAVKSVMKRRSILTIRSAINQHILGIED
jgi:uracil-DNA glycosylase family 4